MEQKIADMEANLRILQVEKSQLAGQLSMEKQINVETMSQLQAMRNSASRTTNLEAGLSTSYAPQTSPHDYDPFDLSFLPQWSGLTMTNDRLRSLAKDTFKQMIQTILVDMRTRIVSLTAQSPSDDLRRSVSEAFAFLNRCYRVEPVRYREIVCELMDHGEVAKQAGEPVDVEHKPLTPEQERRISAAVETFESICESIWKRREEAIDKVRALKKQSGSELECMRSYLGVHDSTQTMVESLKKENAALVDFLTQIGIILGPLQLTRTMFSRGGQDIIAYCKGIHTRFLIMRDSGGAMASHAQPTGGAALPTGEHSDSLMQAGSLVDNYQLLGVPTPLDLEHSLQGGSNASMHSEHHNAHVPKRSLSPAPEMYPQHTPFEFGPTPVSTGMGRDAAGVPRPAKVARSEGAEHGTSAGNSALPHSTASDPNGRPSLFQAGASLGIPSTLSYMGSAGLSQLLKDTSATQVPSYSPLNLGSLGDAPVSSAGQELLRSLTQQQHLAQQMIPVSVSGGMQDLHTLLAKKEGSATLDALAKNVTTNRTLTADELLSLGGIPGVNAKVSAIAAAAPRTLSPQTGNAGLEAIPSSQ